MVRTKSVYDGPEAEDGFRLLIMRKWPRGIAKRAINEWRKELGPSPKLLEEWRTRRIDWEEFSRRYREEMTAIQETIAWLRGKAREGTVTLLCGCKDEQHCHRLLLKQIVEEVSHGN